MKIYRRHLDALAAVDRRECDDSTVRGQAPDHVRRTLARRHAIEPLEESAMVYAKARRKAIRELVQGGLLKEFALWAASSWPPNVDPLTASGRRTLKDGLADDDAVEGGWVRDGRR